MKTKGRGRNFMGFKRSTDLDSNEEGRKKMGVCRNTDFDLYRNVKKQLRSDIDAPELDIL